VRVKYLFFSFFRSSEFLSPSKGVPDLLSKTLLVFFLFCLFRFIYVIRFIFLTFFFPFCWRNSYRASHAIFVLSHALVVWNFAAGDCGRRR
jgi:hypothetical protein